MAQYGKFILKIRSEKAPDWGIGKGVIASFVAKLDDDDQTAAIQIMNLKDDIVAEHIEVISEPISEDEYMSDSPDEKSEQEILIEFFKMMNPNEWEEEMGFSLEEEEMRGDRIWYKEHYNVPNDIEWVGQHVFGVGQWENMVFLFNKNNKYIGISRKLYDKEKHYMFDPIELKYVIGPENHKKYFGNEKETNL